MQPGWYWRRLRRMSASEVAARARTAALHRAWRHRQVRPGTDAPPPGGRGRSRRSGHAGRPMAALIPPGTADAVPAGARNAVVEAADRLLDGRWELLGVVRDDLADPDWSFDPVTGRRAPDDRYAFAIDHRSESEVGNVKQLWELSRHHHLTVLAAAWFLTLDDRYAKVVDSHLRSWWQENPNLSGVHWTSGIELGIRLISWVWARRLLDGWAGAADLFEDNPDAVRQVGWHLRWLQALPSTGSSANNHAVAEAAGQLAGACAFGWFDETEVWRDEATRRLERELERNTFPSGVNRELASDYHCLVTELGLLAAVEADAAGRPLGAPTWDLLTASLDAAAAMVDEAGRGPRQGDGDDGRALLVDGPDANHWPSLLALGSGLVGSQPWWPATPADVRSTVVAALTTRRPGPAGRPGQRPSQFVDAGMTILRTAPGQAGREIWCRCDGGPHGFLSIAAHAHADALAVEVRHGGVDVLADPGTYCYHGEPLRSGHAGRPEWRAWFRSTLGHNTLELGGSDQSEPGGPFLWTTEATTRVLWVADDGDDGAAWSAEHDGYQRLDPPAVHRRTVRLDRRQRRLEIDDRVASAVAHPCRLAFHLGPEVSTALDGAVAALEWPGGTAVMRLPDTLRWSAHRGGTGPVRGWYSPGFGTVVEATTLVGTGTAGGTGPGGGAGLVTIVEFGR